MRILITGGCGFLGSNLAYEALQRKYEVVVFDSLYRTGSKNNLEWLNGQAGKAKFNFIHADIRNYNDIENVVRDIEPEVVFHLAGQVAMTTSLLDPRRDFETNTLGTHNLLETIRKHAPHATVIYSSTNKVYGDLEEFKYIETDTRYIAPDFKNGFDETVRLDFRSPYGCSKGAADQYMLDYARNYQLKTVVFRHSSIYGGRQFSTFDQGWIGWFVLQAIQTQKKKQQEPFTISGDGKQVRDVLFSTDLVNCYYSAVKNITQCAGQAFNIGGGMSNSLSLLELFSILEDELEIKLEHKRLPWRTSDQKVFVADISKANRLFSWTPNIDKLTGIRHMIDWVRKSHV